MTRRKRWRGLFTPWETSRFHLGNQYRMSGSHQGLTLREPTNTHLRLSCVSACGGLVLHTGLGGLLIGHGSTRGRGKRGGDTTKTKEKKGQIGRPASTLDAKKKTCFFFLTSPMCRSLSERSNEENHTHTHTATAVKNQQIYTLIVHYMARIDPVRSHTYL